LRVAFFGESQRDNPYLDLLESALKKQGVVIEPVGSDYLSGRWLISHRTRIGVLHFHWIQYHYVKAPCVGSWCALVKFVGQIFLARVLGYRIVWTLHNVLPHERVNGQMDVVARKAMALLAHSALVLCEEGRRQLAEQFGRRKQVYVTPLGHYVGAHLDKVSRGHARMKLGLRSKDIMYLFFGGVRPHKNVEALLQTFAEMPGEDMRLFIVGAAHGDEIRQRVPRMAATDCRVTTVLEFVPDDEVQYYMRAADIVVSPFAKVLSSSSVILAMSFGRPVIAPAIGCLPEWVTTECGILYDPTDSEGLRRAMLAAQSADLTGMGQAAYQRALAFSWDVIARETLAAYLRAERGRKKNPRSAFG